MRGYRDLEEAAEEAREYAARFGSCKIYVLRGFFKDPVPKMMDPPALGFTIAERFIEHDCYVTSDYAGNNRDWEVIHRVSRDGTITPPLPTAKESTR